MIVFLKSSTDAIAEIIKMIVHEELPLIIQNCQSHHGSIILGGITCKKSFYKGLLKFPEL